MAPQKPKKTGTVKWFDPQWGYGFIEPDSGGEDVFVHFSELQMAGFKSLEDGDRVRYNEKMLETGPGAENVELVEDVPSVDVSSTEERVEAWVEDSPSFETYYVLVADDVYIEFADGSRKEHNDPRKATLFDRIGQLMDRLHNYDQPISYKSHIEKVEVAYRNTEEVE